MSVLIKGMEMPKGCASCFLKYGSCASIRKRMDVSKGDRWCPENYRHPDCSLTEVPEWIPVAERLPDSDTEYVLCCGSKGGMFVGWAAIKTYDGSGKCTGFQNSGKGRNFTHWMPLPKPPKDGAE